MRRWVKPAPRFLNSSWSSPDAPRTSPPASQTSEPAFPRRAALAPQPVAGVAYWLLAGVVNSRLAGVETEVLEKLEWRTQPCTRQPRWPSAGWLVKVTLPSEPVATELAPTRPALRSSW